MTEEDKNGQFKEIAERLRSLREISDITPAKLAGAIGMSEGEYRAVESGEGDIPVGVLLKLSAYYHVDITEFLTGSSARLHTYSLIRNGKGIGVERTDDYIYKSLAYSFANRKAEPFLVEIPFVEGKKPHFNTHAGHEFHYCLEGSFSFFIDNHQVEVAKGDSLYFDSAHPHAMKATGGKAAKSLVIVIL